MRGHAAIPSALGTSLQIAELHPSRVSRFPKAGPDFFLEAADLSAEQNDVIFA